MILELGGDDMRGAGGTPGGLFEFLIGFVMLVGGAWLLSNQVVVTSGAWTLWGYSSFGLSLLPFMVGTGLLFADGKSKIGWLLLIAGVTIIFFGIITNLHLYFQSTSLFNTLMMLGLIAGGIGLLARAVRSHS